MFFLIIIFLVIIITESFIYFKIKIKTLLTLKHLRESLIFFNISNLQNKSEQEYFEFTKKLFKNSIFIFSYFIVNLFIIFFIDYFYINFVNNLFKLQNIFFILVLFFLYTNIRKKLYG